MISLITSLPICSCTLFMSSLTNSSLIQFPGTHFGLSYLTTTYDLRLALDRTLMLVSLLSTPLAISTVVIYIRCRWGSTLRMSSVYLGYSFESFWGYTLVSLCLYYVHRALDTWCVMLHSDKSSYLSSFSNTRYHPHFHGQTQAQTGVRLLLLQSFILDQ